jgi:hypothetical protein
MAVIGVAKSKRFFRGIVFDKRLTLIWQSLVSYLINHNFSFSKLLTFA